MDNKYSDSQIVKWSCIVLCVSLVLVYVVLYYAKWDLWTSDFDVCSGSDLNISLSELSNYDWSPISDTGNESIDNLLSVWDDFPQKTWNDSVLDTWTIDFDTWVDFESWSNVEWMVVLSWTKTYYWDLDFVNLLWISYKYALVDEKWIYYLNMWDYIYDFSDIARKLWWNLYIMNTEQEILSNQLFGDKITFINVPEYKNMKVLMLLDVNKQSRLLAVDYSIYHQVKSYLKSLFIY